MKYVCKVCGYVYEGDNPPNECPKCHKLDVMEPVQTKNPYAGTKTEKIYLRHLPENPRQETSIPILHLWQRRQAMNKSLRFS